MLHVTPQARVELHAMLDRVLAEHPQTPGEPSDALCFRLVTDSDAEDLAELGLALDPERPGDEVVEHEGRTVLVIDARASELMDQVTLDLIETPEGIRLGLLG